MQPAWMVRRGDPGRPGRSGSDVAAGEQRGDSPCRFTYDRQGEQHGRVRMEPRVSVEQRRPDQPGPRRELGYRGFRTRTLHTSGPTAVDELQVRDLTYCPYGRLTALCQLPGGVPLHPAHHRGLWPTPGIRHAGDLTLVSHHGNQPEPWPGEHCARELPGLSRREQRRTSCTDVHSGQWPPRGVEFEAHPQPWMIATEHTVDEFQVLDRINHDRDAGPGVSVRGESP